MSSNACKIIPKAVQHRLSPRAKANLKRHHLLLNSPIEVLKKESQKQLFLLLIYSPLLCQVWEWKEVFTIWYDGSPNVYVAEVRFERWGFKVAKSSIPRSVHIENDCKIKKRKSSTIITADGRMQL
uniref:transposase n=1 Tax=Paenibacillus curdlanolyticus TaxID=59840 RepID=UPI0013053A6D